MLATWCRMQALRRSFSTSCRLGNTSRPRVNEMKIQLLSESLHKQIFQTPASSAKVSDIIHAAEDIITKGGNSATDQADVEIKSDHPLHPVQTVLKGKLSNVKSHLDQHGLWDKESRIEENVEFKIPPLLGSTIDEHFEKLGERLIGDYTALADRLARCKIPRMPANWRYKEGWTRYESDGTTTSVDYPEGSALVFDVETVVSEGSYPTMATAVSDTHWYSWSSDYLVNNPFRWSQVLNIDDLIPLESGPASDHNNSPRLVVGHNVGFDRSFAKEQYYINKSKLRFMDTMSMHIAVCGLSNLQRVLYRAGENDSKIKKVEEYRQKQRERRVFIVEDWKEVSSLNSLQAVHELHVGGKKLDKDIRNTFIEGTTEDVRENFQDLMTYCANDVVATLEVFQSLWPEFQNRFPHKVTLAGMMEMSTGYLPINENWERYVHQSNSVYEDMQRECKQLLMKLANDACELLQNERYKNDPWLWDLDWTVKEFKIKKPKPPKKKKTKLEEEDVAVAEEDENCVDQVLKLQEQHYKVGNFMSGYPLWYKDICAKLTDPSWAPGPCNISSQTRVTPKLLRLTWDGYPLHFNDEHGWGYLVPGRTDNLVKDEEDLHEATKERHFPYDALCRLMYTDKTDDTDAKAADTNDVDDDADVEELEAALFEEVRQAEDRGKEISLDEVMKYMENIEHKRKREKAKNKAKPKSKEKKTTAEHHVGDGPYDSVNIPGCWFYKIPHKDGKGKRVGNPLAKDYLMHMEDGTLNAHSGQDAGRVLKLNKMYSYWKNNQKRIESQMLVWLNEQELPDTVKENENYRDGFPVGAIVPRIVPAGTITRRAVEKTWLTASNAYEDRVGSELKSMIQSPPGYCFVGADVDSQELWIGALLGDSTFAKSHGCTALGWMTLQGNKADGTDLHSKVAHTVGVSRDHAKIFNYGRIYGAGQAYAEKLLMQFNHRLTEEEAKKKAKLMFVTTKGKKDRKTGRWEGGSESYMFNKLEEIARSKYPQTPVLGCRISKALEPENVNEDFMTSRINWVVQSSAVDYLHLMLVCMRWLFEEYEIDGRFCISIHDEVRYLVAEKDKYRAALALQITNLLTRSLFAYKLGMYDLPQSVAFFSTVDIDKCLRKEVNLKCVTPSNIRGMDRGYQMYNGEALKIDGILRKTGATLEKRTDDNSVETEDRSMHNDNNGAELLGNLRGAV